MGGANGTLTLPQPRSFGLQHQRAPRIIDTHHHFYPPKFTAELVKRWNEADSQKAAIIPNGFEGELQRQYYDVASVATSPPGMAAVLKCFSTTHLLFGSDVPYWTIGAIVDGLTSLGLPAQDLRMIQRDNALTLLPRLRASGA
jgi:predicted TIM-barrel fold metal-dependent hydrolase